MVSFELSKEIEKDAFTSDHKPGQRKSSKSPYSIIFLYIIIYIIFCKILFTKHNAIDITNPSSLYRTGVVYELCNGDCSP